jgi:hypothetical protein
MRAWFIVAFAGRRPGLSNLRVLVNPALLGTIRNSLIVIRLTIFPELMIMV